MSKRNRPRRAAPSAPVEGKKPLARDGLQNVVAGLGTDRDKMAYGQYTSPLLLNQINLGNIYRSSWLAKKIVNVPAEDMTRGWRTFMFDDEGAQETNQFALEDEERRLCAHSCFRDALAWARLYGGAGVLLGVENEKLETPLDPAKVKKGGLRYLRALDRWTLLADGSIDWNIASDNFGLPEFYRVGIQSGPRVHHSRVIRFIGQKLPFLEQKQVDYWGDSELQATYDTLMSRDTMTAAIATMMFEANVDVVTAPDLTELLSTQDGEAKLTKRFQVAGLMKSFNRMLLLDGEEKYEKKSNSFSGLDSIMREFRAEVAGACDIPVTRLFGTSVSGLNATGDNEIRNYYDMIAARQRAQLQPQLERFDEVFVRSALGAMPDDYRFEFGTLWQMDETEKANVEKSRADRDKIYFDMGVLNEGVIARELKESGTYATMTEEDVTMAEELSQALEEQRLNPPDPLALAEAKTDEPEGAKPPGAIDE